MARARSPEWLPDYDPDGPARRGAAENARTFVVVVIVVVVFGLSNSILYIIDYAIIFIIFNVYSRKLAKLAGVTLAIARFLSTGCKS